MRRLSSVIFGTNMEKPPLATIINFCTNERRYIEACIQEALLFSRQVIVVLSDHFFDGTKEDGSLLNEIYSAFPDCLFVEYPFIPEVIPKFIFEKVEPAHFWHSLSRLVGTKFVEKEIDFLLFLDADEIIEGERFREWLDFSDFYEHTVVKLANYWYFRLPEYQALQWEDSPVIVQKKAASPEILLSTEERQAIYDFLPGPKKRMATGTNGAPMVHHYSWVRSEEEMLKKVQSWGHKKDRDWESLVKEEFLSPFKGIDFVHGYSFKTVSPSFKISMEEPQFLKKGKENLKKVEKEDLLSFLGFLKKQSAFVKILKSLFVKDSS